MLAFAATVDGGGVRSDRIVEDVGLVAFDPGADEAVEFLGFEQERIVAEIGGEFGVTGAFAGTEERESELAILLGRKSQSLVKPTMRVSASTAAKACSSVPWAWARSNWSRARVM